MRPVDEVGTPQRRGRVRGNLSPRFDVYSGSRSRSASPAPPLLRRSLAMRRPMLLASITCLFASALVLRFVQADPPAKLSQPGGAAPKAASQPRGGDYIIGAPI